MWGGVGEGKPVFLGMAFHQLGLEMLGFVEGNGVLIIISGAEF
jgi:hypothetical protein